MWQNSYALYYTLKNVSKKTGLGKVYLRFFSGGYYDLLLCKRVIKVTPDQFDTKAALTQNPIKRSHPDAISLNKHLNEFKSEVTNKLLNTSAPITKEYLEGSTGTSDRITDFIEDYVYDMREEWSKHEEALIKGVKKIEPDISLGRLKIYEVISNKVASFQPKASFKDISVKWLISFQKHLSDSDIAGSTLSSNLRTLKGILGHAKSKGMIDEAQYKDFIPPEEEIEIPEYLEEHEINQFHNVTQFIQDETKKTYGYYFLLGCYAGYRLSDIMSFDYEQKVKSNRIVLRAKKNGTIVSIALYERLVEVVNYCKDNPFPGTEQEFRKQVKEIAKLAGIKGSRVIKIHTSRHSFAMMMMEKGLSTDEVAELIGDTPLVAKIYARIANKSLSDKVNRVMK